MASKAQYASATEPIGKLVSSADVNVPAAATAAVITLAANATGAWCIGGVAWSYSAAPTGGRLTITDGGTTVFDLDITAAGPGSVLFPVPKKGAVNSQMVITLASGAGAVVGKVNLLGKWIET